MASSEDSAEVRKHAITVLGQQLDAVRKAGFHYYQFGHGDEEDTGAVEVARELVKAIKKLGGGDGE